MHPSCQTLGVTRNKSVNLVHRAFARKPSTQAIQCLSASAELHVRAVPTLRTRPEVRPFVAVAKVAGYSLKRATRASRNHRAKAVRAQSVPALARRRRQMLVSQWALPLSAGRRGLQDTAPRSSGVGGVQSVPRFPPSVTPNPSFKRTASPPLNSNVRRRKCPSRNQRPARSQ